MKKTTLKVSKVSFDEDGLVALYVGDELVHSGHANDFIDNEMDGWILCLKSQGNKVEEDHFYVEVDQEDYPEAAPKTLKALLKKYKRIEE
jgi:hypothetical protein